MIQRSNSAQTARLIGDLIGADPVRREAAIARLAIVGERAVDRLLAALDSASPMAGTPPADAAAAGASAADAAVVILRTLELIGSPRAVPAAIARLQASNDAIAIAAVAAIRPHLRAADDEVASNSLEALTTLALARERSDPPRVAALEALSEMGAETLEPIHARLRLDPSARVRRLVDAAATDVSAGASAAAPPSRPGRGQGDVKLPATRHGASRTTGRVTTGGAGSSTELDGNVLALARLEAAARGELPEEADALRSLLTHAGGTVALSVLHDLVIALRTKEQQIAEAGGPNAAAAALDWMAARGAAHQALAERHSRLAVFDLRDTFDHASERLPLGFVAAITDVGDASCLPPLAAAWRQVNDGWMRDHLVAAFQAIMLREGLTRRHGAVRKALERAPDAADALIKRASGPSGASGRSRIGR